MQRKIGAMFLITTIALAGIGVSYAGFFDEIHVSAEVDVANVDLDLYCYSCTLLWKIWDYTVDPLPSYPGLEYPAAEVAVYRGFDCAAARAAIEALFDDDAYFDGEWEFVACATASDPTPDVDDNKVTMSWNNIFPCTDFSADFVFHYDGSIPAKIAYPTITWTVGGANIPVTFQAFKMIWDDLNDDDIVTCDELIRGQEITLWPIQVHRCNFIMIVVTIHLPQVNDLQGDGDGTTFEHEFEFTVRALQWYDPCPP